MSDSAGADECDVRNSRMGGEMVSGLWPADDGLNWIG